ncbi:MAG: ankyrin repeat domain-containing protein [Wolbachia endosymbiont of Penenirmus auritus]|nr:ankyrin repeat domain-containing protein [Wolbachia endosymbiont of Penenirmus auritus]
MTTINAKKPEQILSEKASLEIKEAVEKAMYSNECELIKSHLLWQPVDSSLVDDGGLFLDSLMYMYFVNTPGLTKSQEVLNKELLGIILNTVQAPCPDSDEENNYTIKLAEFLEKHKKNPDLKTVLDLKRGESELTVLHAISSLTNAGGLDYAMDLLLKAGANPNKQDSRGRTPLHYATGLNCIALLLEGKADPSIRDNRGRTPLQVAIDNHHYYIKECFLTDDQRSLKEELYDILEGYDDYYHTLDQDDITESLKEFLDKNKKDQDLKVVLNLRNKKGKSSVLEYTKRHFGNSVVSNKVRNLLLEAGAIDYKGLDREEHLLKSRTLWSNLIPYQKRKLGEFLNKVSKAQDMDQLKEVVDEAINLGIRFNFPVEGPCGMYNFTDYVIEKISKLEKNPKVASNIICNLVLRGAVLHRKLDIAVTDELELEFEGHKTNMIKAYEGYANRTLEFMEIAENAATGEVKDVKIDNSTLYLEYSGDSTIHVAKITDGARDLGLTQGEAGYGRDVIKIGKSEVEIITVNDTRYYTDLADGSDIVLTFPTSLGELEVRLYPDEQDQNLIRVEGNKEMLKKLEDCGEEIGKNCRLGGLSVKEAIGQEYFTRSGGLMRSEAMSPSEKVLEKVGAVMKGFKPGDIVTSSLGNTSSIEVVKLKSEGNAQNSSLISI